MDADGRDGDGLLRKLTNLYNLQKFADDIVVSASSSGAKFVVSEELIKSLHRVAMSRLLPDAGQYRKSQVTIRGSNHVPPNFIEVEAHMRGLCDYLNTKWDTRDLVHLAAFAMWRLNWVHPFANGNGRTTRALSYLVMCAKYGGLLPAKKSVVKQIVEPTRKQQYHQALGYADQVYAATQDVGAAILPMESLISELLKEQLKANFT